jgi:hypothetical protein
MRSARVGVTSSAVLGVGAMSRWRIAVQALGVTAMTVLVVVGCTTVTAGSPAVNVGDATSYRTWAAGSSSHAAAEASAQESTRKERMTAEAVADACEVLSSSSVDVVTAINAYVKASTTGDEADVQAKAQSAVDVLNRAADSVASSLNTPLLPAMAGALAAWVDATRVVTKAITERYVQQEFNAAVDKFNQANADGLNSCGGSR